MDIPILGQQSKDGPKLGGADENGIVHDGPVLLSQLLNLMDKARFAIAGSACLMGCIEHKDPMIYSSAVEQVGLWVFAMSIEEVSSEIITNEDEVKNFTILLANRCGHNINKMRQYIDYLKGFSDKTKKQFFKDVKEFVIQTMAKNIQGFSTTVASIIQA